MDLLASPSHSHSPRGRTAKLSRALTSPPGPLRAPPQTQTPPPEPEPDFTFAPAATSTQQQQPQHGAREGFGLEACVAPRGSGVLGLDVDVDADVDVDFEGWVRDVPVVEAGDDDVGAAGVGVGVSSVSEGEKGAGSFLFEGESGLPDTGRGLGLGRQALRVSAPPAAADEQHV